MYAVRGEVFESLNDDIQDDDNDIDGVKDGIDKDDDDDDDDDEANFGSLIFTKLLYVIGGSLD